MDDEVELGQIFGPSDLVSGEQFGSHKIFKIFVVGDGEKVKLPPNNEINQKERLLVKDTRDQVWPILNSLSRQKSI